MKRSDIDIIHELNDDNYKAGYKNGRVIGYLLGFITSLIIFLVILYNLFLK